jgi:hypothetical protein
VNTQVADGITEHRADGGRASEIPALALMPPPGYRPTGSAWQLYRPSKAVMMSRTWSGASLQVASPTDSSTRCTPGSIVVMAFGQTQIRC